MNNLFKNLEGMKDASELKNISESSDLQKEMLSENLELAKKEGNEAAIKFYESQLSQYSVDTKLNEESDMELGSSCEDFCQSTQTNRTSGNYTRRGR